MDPAFGLDSSGIAGTAAEKKEDDVKETKMEEGEQESKEENVSETKEEVSLCIIVNNSLQLILWTLQNKLIHIWSNIRGLFHVK